MGMNLNKSISEAHTIAKVGTGNVTVKRSRIELGQHKDLVNPAVDAVAHWNVDQPIASSKVAEEWCAILWYDLMRSERTVENKEGEDMGPTALTAGVVDVILATNKPPTQTRGRQYYPANKRKQLPPPREAPELQCCLAVGTLLLSGSLNCRPAKRSLQIYGSTREGAQIYGSTAKAPRSTDLP
nr:hypothetical protein Iba_chr04cCG1770 [Ipomoea batatas]